MILMMWLLLTSRLMYSQIQEQEDVRWESLHEDYNSSDWSGHRSHVVVADVLLAVWTGPRHRGERVPWRAAKGNLRRRSRQHPNIQHNIRWVVEPELNWLMDNNLDAVLKMMFPFQSFFYPWIETHAHGPPLRFSRTDFYYMIFPIWIRITRNYFASYYLIIKLFDNDNYQKTRKQLILSTIKI